MERTLITQDRLQELVRLSKLSGTGFKCEVGVYQGGSLKYMATECPNDFFFGVDTFTGLPATDWTPNEVHKPFDFADTDIVSVQKFIARPNVLLIKGELREAAHQLNEYRFSFVHCDMDFQAGTELALSFFPQRMLPGGIMVFDDYLWPRCPGVQIALDAFSINNGIPHMPTKAKYQAYVQF